MISPLGSRTGEANTTEFLWAKWAVVALLAYWTAFALVAPVTNYDSQTYNLARLSIAQAHGLFGNPGWSTVRQVVFPWTFDAIHYPFVLLRGGYNLPSFACFLGLLIIVYRRVAATGRAAHAWLCCLALLALPTLVFQSLCTKNDVAVVFGVACWYYAWGLWTAERRNVYLLFMALALAFAAGAKTSGLPLFALLGAFTLWHLRSSPWSAVRFVCWMAVFFVLFGSVEIYINNQRLYHAPLGPPEFIAQNQNRDGLAGGIANFIRYCFGNMSVGIDAANPSSPFASWMENTCRQFLSFVGLSNGVGYRSGFGEVDANMQFLKLGLDSESDFGPVGALALVASLIFVLALSHTDPVWKLAAAGIATMFLTSYTVAWMMWNTRFLVLSFALFTLALTLWILRLNLGAAGRFLRSAYFTLAVFSAVIYPLNSFNKRPSDLKEALIHRSAYGLRERLAMLEVVKDLQERTNVNRPSELLLHAGPDSWVFCIMDLPGLHVVSTPVLDMPALVAASKHHGAGTGDLPVYVLLLNLPVDPALAPALTLVKKYGEIDTTLFKWEPPGDAPLPAKTALAPGAAGTANLPETPIGGAFALTPRG